MKRIRDLSEEEVIEEQKEDNPALSKVIARNIRTIISLHQRSARERSLQERVADAITSFSGTLNFLYINVIWFGVWVLLNTGLFGIRPFDPCPYWFLTMVVSLEAIILSILVLISQNRLRVQSERRANLDLHIGLLAENELTRVLQMLSAIQDKLGIENDEDSTLADYGLEMETKPEDVMAEIERLEKRAHNRTMPGDGVQQRSVLYVEDNPANMRLIERLIARRPDLRLLTAVTGNLGIEYARTAQPDVILMDINLPDISGIEVLNILRKDPDTAHIPVVAISANAMPHDITKGLKAGFFRYLTKPIIVNEFLQTLNEALEFTYVKNDISKELPTVIPIEIIEKLQEAALSADLDSIMDLLHQVEAYDPDFTNKLRNLASSFNYQSILDLLLSKKDKK